MDENQLKLERIRHSSAHLLAAAVEKLYPNALPTVGPATETGFFYDFDFGDTPPSENDLKKIEKEMRKILPTWKSFERIDVSEKEARKRFANNPYKLEIIDGIIEAGEPITLYQSGEFVDLCRGGHVEDIKDIKPDAFKLTHVSGAYWRGDETNTQLVRVSGLAFESKEELEAFEKMVEEAKLRDHRKLGKEMNLFTFSDLVGPGLPLWTPKGTLLRSELDDFVWELRRARGYQRVTIPHITKKDLYEVSGHWQKFSEELFKITTREGHEFAMKPMNCPHHTQIFASTPKSYRDMPQRYAETTTCYRDEQTGELHGLSRVRAFTQDDAHVFCSRDQVKDEFFAIWDIINAFYTALGFPLSVRLSFHDPDKFDSYLGTPEVWAEAEAALKDLAEERGVEYAVGIGEAAMYGPKIDFMSKDSIGRTWQVATIQLDLNMPQRFGLTFTNEKGEKEDVIMIHAAIMGSLERFTSVLIEHLGGKFPLWLSPTHIAVLPVSEAHTAYAEGLKEALQKHGIRVDLLSGNLTLGKRIRAAKLERIPYLAVVGDREVETKSVTLESRDSGKVGEMGVMDLVDLLKNKIESREASV